jgi:hypothetical protein
MSAPLRFCPASRMGMPFHRVISCDCLRLPVTCGDVLRAVAMIE